MTSGGVRQASKAPGQDLAKHIEKVDNYMWYPEEHFILSQNSDKGVQS